MTIIPMTSWQIHAEIVASFKNRDWCFDFTHKHVAKILSDLAWYGDIRSKKQMMSDGKTSTVYWKGIDYDWGSNKELWGETSTGNDPPANPKGML